MRFIMFISLLFYLQAYTSADELHVVLNGKALHLSDGDYNEENWGLGLQYDFTPRRNWIKFVTASWLKDSNFNTSKYAGGGIRRRYRLDNNPDGWFFDAGGIIFLMTRKDFKNNRPFLGLLPFVGVGKGPVTLNMTYIPEVSPKHKDLLFLQLVVRVKIFD